MRPGANSLGYRWLVNIQKYDYAIEDIPVADGFSRLVSNNMKPELIASLLPPESIPKNLIKLIGKVHNSVSGHHGFERTLRMLTTPISADSKVTLLNIQTPKLRTHIKQFIALCPCCKKTSMLKVLILTHPFTT